MNNYILILTFLCVFIIIVSLANMIFSRRLNTKARLEYYTDTSYVREKPDNSFKTYFLNGVRSFFDKFMPKHVESRQSQLLALHSKMKPEGLITISLILSVSLFVVLWLLSKQFIIGLLGFLIGYILPSFFLKFKISNRQKLLNDQLPDALTIISNGLRAGFSFNQSLSIVSQELPSPIKDEFSKILSDASYGMSIEKALEDFNKRASDDDVDILVTALIIQRKVGGNLAEILDIITETIRERKRVRAEVRTLTAQGRMSAIIISLLPFGIGGFMLIFNPDYILSLFRHPIGLMLVIGAVVMQVVGMIIIRRMANIEV